MTNDLRSLALAATPGPWHAPGLGEVHAPDHRSVAETMACNDPEDDFPPGQNDANAAYIAAANPKAILALLDVVDKARAAMPALVQGVCALAHAIDAEGMTVYQGDYDAIDAAIAPLRAALDSLGPMQP